MIHVTVAAVCGEKGGIGKSTTASVLAYSLASKGKKVLCVDFCPSGALSSIVGADNTKALNIMDVLTGNCTASEALQTVAIDDAGGKAISLDILSSNSSLSQLDSFVKVTKETLLTALESVMSNYDYIIIDTSPQPKTSSTVTALYASNKIILPALAEPEPTKSLAKMVKTVLQVKGNDAVADVGVLVTRHFPRVNIYKSYYQTIEAYCEKIGIKLFGSISNSCVVPESQDKTKPLTNYKKTSSASIDYAVFTERFLGWEVK